MLIIAQSGLAPARSSVRVPYPVKLADGQVIVANISFPVMVPDTSTPPVSQVSIDGRQKKLIAVNSITEMSLRTLRDDMPGLSSARPIGHSSPQMFKARTIDATRARRPT